MGQAQYFTPRPQAASDPRPLSLALPDLHLDLVSDRGVFAHGAVDSGTRLLLLEGPRPPATGNLLDLGCGYGPIACALAARAPDAAVWAVDVNERALRLCETNAAANGLKNVRAVLPEVVPDDVTFAGIWSNPPIRIGKPALHELLLRWLDRLAPDAVATLVVQQHLGADSLARWLGGHGFEVDRLASRQAFRVMAVHR